MSTGSDASEFITPTHSYSSRVTRNENLWHKSSQFIDLNSSNNESSVSSKSNAASVRKSACDLSFGSKTALYFSSDCQLQLAYKFPRKVSQIFKNLPELDSSHVIAYIDGHSKFVCLLVKGFNFNVRAEVYMWSLLYSDFGASNVGYSIDSLGKNSHILSEADGNNCLYQLTLANSRYKLETQLFMPIVQMDASGRSVVGAIAITAEGQIRYWYRASEPYVVVESLVIDMKPDECCMALSRLSHENVFVLGTSEPRFILLNFTNNNSKINQKELFCSAGLLSTLNFWRRDSALKSEIRKFVLSPNVGCNIWALTSQNIKCLALSQDLTEKKLINFDVSHLILEWFSTNCNMCNSQFQSEVEFLDLLILPGNTFYLLVGISFEQLDDMREYSFYIFQLSINESFVGFKKSLNLIKVIPVPFKTLVHSSSIRSLLVQSSLVASANSDQIIYFRSGNHVAVISLTLENSKIDYLSPYVLTKKSDVLMGIGRVDEKMLLVVPDRGIFEIQTISAVCENEQKMILSSGNASMAEKTERQISMLANAFRSYLSGSNDWHMWNHQLVSADVQDAVVNYISVLTDEIYESSRWAEKLNEVLDSTQMLLHRQIQDKMTIHLKFLVFLKKINIWKKLSLDSKCLFLEYGEKISSMLSLRMLHSWLQIQYSNDDELYDKSVNMVFQFNKLLVETLSYRKATEEKWVCLGLGPQDLFYSSITKIEDFIVSLSSLLNSDFGHKDTSMFSKNLRNKYQFLFFSNQILECIFADAIGYRMENQFNYIDENEDSNLNATIRFWTWQNCYHDLITKQIQSTSHMMKQLNESGQATTSKDLDQLDQNWKSGKTDILSDGIRKAMNEKCDYLYKYPYCISELNVDVLAMQSYNLSYILLYDMRQKAQRTRDGEYEAVYLELRRSLINLFTRDYSDMALKLAESFHDFEVIIEICKKFNYAAKLNNYITKFSDLEFAKFLFQWYKKSNCKHELLNLVLSFSKELSDELYNDADLENIAWINALLMGSFGAASKTLYSLGMAEVKSIEKRKTLFSLAKLSRLVENTAGNEDLLHQPSLRMPEIGVDPCTSNINLSVDQTINVQLKLIQLQIDFIKYDSSSTSLIPPDVFIHKIIELSHVTDDADQKLLLYSYALKIYRLTMNTRTPNENRVILVDIWIGSIKVDDWSLLSNLRQENLIHERMWRSRIDQSTFCRLGRHKDHIKFLHPNIFQQLINSFSDYENFSALKTVLSIAYEVMGTNKS